MAQADIHPEYKTLKIVFPNGNSFSTNSAYKSGKAASGKENQIMVEVDIDNKTGLPDHPAWNLSTDISINTQAAQVKKFNDKFASFMGSKK